MSAPITPSQILQTVPDGTGSLCDRFSDLFKLPQLFFELYTYERNEQGDISDAACADIALCAGSTTVGGGGGGGGGGGTLATPSVNATDGTYTDKVVVTWNAITGATRYEVWRGASNDVSAAFKMSDVNGVTAFTDDGARPNFPLVSGQIYWYFVRAFNDTNTQSSAFSQGDSGYEGAVTATLSGVTDLVASKGFYRHISNTNDPATMQPQYVADVLLRWTPVAGAVKYDIYRNATDDYSTATRIKQDATFNPPTFSAGGGFHFDAILNNGPDLAYADQLISVGANDPLVFSNLYYWVVPKGANPGVIGPTSNSNAGALGWGVGQGQGIAPDNDSLILQSGGAAVAVPPLITKAWIKVGGASGSGAGGNASVGGGGGGQSATVVGLMSVASSGKFRVVSSPEADPASGIHDANGVAGPVSKLQYSADGFFDDTVDVVTLNAPGGGVFNAGGTGAGGAGAGATVNLLSPFTIYDGKPGFASVTGVGGNSGYSFGSGKGVQQNWPSDIAFGGPNPADAGNGHAGGGSSRQPNYPLLATGGKGARALAQIVWFE